MATAKGKKNDSAKPMGNTKEDLGYDPDKGIGKVIFFFQKTLVLHCGSCCGCGACGSYDVERHFSAQR